MQFVSAAADAAGSGQPCHLPSPPVCSSLHCPHLLHWQGCSTCSSPCAYPAPPGCCSAGETGVFTSAYRGVTKHRLTGRYEAHFWDAQYVRPNAVSDGGPQCLPGLRCNAGEGAGGGCSTSQGAQDSQGTLPLALLVTLLPWRLYPAHPPPLACPQKKGGRSRGRQVYLGGYETELEAARAYDRAVIAHCGIEAPLNVRGSHGWGGPLHPTPSVSILTALVSDCRVCPSSPLLAPSTIPRHLPLPAVRPGGVC